MFSPSSLGYRHHLYFSATWGTCILPPYLIDIAERFLNTTLPSDKLEKAVNAAVKNMLPGMKLHQFLTLFKKISLRAMIIRNY